MAIKHRIQKIQSGSSGKVVGVGFHLGVRSFTNMGFFSMVEDGDYIFLKRDTAEM
jgi:hypothetical protein